MKTIWDIVKLETNKDPTAEQISILNVEGKRIKKINKQSQRPLIIIFISH
jgi:hypothetical protein